MSASLVGSEMCIRDRCLHTARAGQAEPTWAPGGLHVLLRGCAAQCEAPVSYTHLTLPTICSV
eukprot:1226810-Alexandrium_andersonii.AAC.1